MSQVQASEKSLIYWPACMSNLKLDLLFSCHIHRKEGTALNGIGLTVMMMMTAKMTLSASHTCLKYRVALFLIHFNSFFNICFNMLMCLLLYVRVGPQSSRT